MIWYKKILILLIVTIIIKRYISIYIILFLILFSLEHLYFLSYVKKIFIKDRYICIEPEYKHLDNIVDLWIHYCKLCAFKRIYLLCKKTKISLLTILLAIIIISLGIPIKVLKVVNFLIEYGSLKEGIKLLYYTEYDLIKDCKIENLKGRILLNNQLETFFMHFLHAARNNKEIMKDLDKITYFFSKSQKVIFNDFTRNANKKLPVYWVTPYIGDRQVCRPHLGEHYEEARRTWYQVSNFAKINEAFQKKFLYLPELVTSHAKNPGTIFSSHYTKVIVNKNWEPKYVSAHILIGFKCMYSEELGNTDITIEDRINFLNSREELRTIFKEVGFQDDEFMNRMLLGHYKSIAPLDEETLKKEFLNYINKIKTL